jgi:hypothetical protein
LFLLVIVVIAIVGTFEEDAIASPNVSFIFFEPWSPSLPYPSSAEQLR